MLDGSVLSSRYLNDITCSRARDAQEERRVRQFLYRLMLLIAAAIKTCCYYYYQRMKYCENNLSISFFFSLFFFFLFLQVVGKTCDIVADAVERYKAIILTEARIAKISSQGHTRSQIRDNTTITDTLNTLNIHLREPCEKDGNHWPYLGMDESCESFRKRYIYRDGYF